MNREDGMDSAGAAPRLSPQDFGIGRLFWTVREAVIVADATTGRILLWNPAAEGMFGYSSEEACRLTVDALVPERLRAQHRAGMIRFRETGHGPFIDAGVPLDVPATRKNGDEFSIELSLSPVDGDNGGRHVLAVIRDITDRKRAEEERGRRLQEQVTRLQDRAAEWRLAFLASAGTVLASSLDYQATLTSVARLAVPQLADWCSVHIIEPDGQIRRMALAHVDPAKERMIEELRVRYPLRPGDRHPVAEVLRSERSLLYSELPSSMLVTMAQDAEHLRLLREIGFGSYMCVPLAARGQTLGAITFVTSASGRRYGPVDLAMAENLARRSSLALENARLYEEAQQALRDAEAALAMRDEFLSIASHELRTPLTALKGYVQITRRRLGRGAPPAELDDLTARVDAQADRLARLVNDLLDVSRIAAGRFVIESSPTPLAPLVRHVIDQQQSIEPERRIDLVVDAEPVIEADANRMEEVVANLIENARKYSHAGLPIHITVGVRGAAAVITVRDEGIGIPEADRQRIFERFHRGGNIDKGVSGLGLGLYIAGEIVQLHGGRLAVESAPGAGSTFTLELPTYPPHPL